MIVQSIGGAKASLAKNMVDANRGGHIALGDYPLTTSLLPGKGECSTSHPAGGIAFQFIGILVYLLLTSEFLIRYALNKPFSRPGRLFIAVPPPIDFKTSQMIFGVCLSSLCMFTRYSPFPSCTTRVAGRLSLPHRGVYRTIELTGGWSGSVISNQSLFSRCSLSRCLAVLLTTMLTVGFDGSMIVLALAVLSIFHPGRLLTGETGIIVQLESLTDFQMFAKGV